MAKRSGASSKIQNKMAVRGYFDNKDITMEINPNKIMANKITRAKYPSLALQVFEKWQYRIVEIMAK